MHFLQGLHGFAAGATVDNRPRAQQCTPVTLILPPRLRLNLPSTVVPFQHELHTRPDMNVIHTHTCAKPFP